MICEGRKRSTSIIVQRPIREMDILSQCGALLDQSLLRRHVSDEWPFKL